MLAVLGALRLFSLFELQKSLYAVASLQELPSKLNYVFVSFVMGNNEEIMYRPGLMSKNLTVLQTLKYADNPTNKMVWTSIIITWLIFGMMHFPVTSNFFKLTPFTICVTMIGKLITRTTFGWILWKRGLLAVMIVYIAFYNSFHVIGLLFGKEE